MYSKIIFILILGVNSLFAQQKKIVRYSNSELFKGEAIIFTDNYTPPIKLETQKLFTPTTEQIEMAEQTFFRRYNLDLTNLNWYEYEKNVRKKYWKYNRQYLGFIDSLGKKNIIINFLNFKCRRKSKEKFAGWKEFYFVGFGKYYEKNSIRFVVNIENKRIKLK